MTGLCAETAVTVVPVTTEVPAAAVVSLPADLAEALRYGPFHRALHAAIAHRGLSLSRLRVHLERLGVPVGVSTLSYWQRGLRHPEVPRAINVVRALEVVLHLPADSLLVLVGPRTRPADWAPAPFAEVSRSWADTTDLLAEFDALPERRCNADLDVLAVHDTVLLGANREQRAVTTRIVARARRSGPDRYLAVHQGDPGCRIEDALVRAAEGCRPGRVRRKPSACGLVVELLFDRRLAEGETHVFCFTVVDDTGGATPGHYRTFRGRAGSYLLQLACHRRALPVRCTQTFRVREDVAPEAVQDLVCGLGGVVSAYFPTVGPGAAGVTIEWI